MSTVLGINEASRPVTGDVLAQAKKVRTIGIIALILAVSGIVIPFIADIAAFILSKWAMKISRDNLVPVEYEKSAYWAYRVSIMGIILWVVALIRILA